MSILDKNAITIVSLRAGEDNLRYNSRFDDEADKIISVLNEFAVSDAFLNADISKGREEFVGDEVAELVYVPKDGSVGVLARNNDIAAYFVTLVKGMFGGIEYPGSDISLLDNYNITPEAHARYMHFAKNVMDKYEDHDAKTVSESIKERAFLNDEGCLAVEVDVLDDKHTFVFDKSEFSKRT